MKNLALPIVLILLLAACQDREKDHASEGEETSPKHVDEVKQTLKQNLLDVWYPRTIDHEMGGFYTNFDHEWKRLALQNKMIVTQSRHLWTLSQAAQEFPEDTLFAEAAHHAYEFLTEKMWDSQNGGFYWLVNRDGKPVKDGRNSLLKRVYGQSFGLYALSAYYALSREEEVLEHAKEVFQWIENHAHDGVHGGYFSTLNQYGKPILQDTSQKIPAASGFLYKDQNTSIHLLEAFTALYQVWPDALLASRLKEMLHLIRDRMVSDQGYLRLYFQNDWTPVSYIDSAIAIREAHYHLDHVSFGHDIETAYLMLEASEALEDYQHEETLFKAKQMVDHTLNWGFDIKNSGIYDRGYYMPDSDTVSIVLDHKSWWAQAEGLNALYLFSTLYPDEAKYRDEFEKLWRYTQAYIIDYEHGGWFLAGLDTYPEADTLSKASPWKGNYHNVRALINLGSMMEK